MFGILSTLWDLSYAISWQNISTAELVWEHYQSFLACCDAFQNLYLRGSVFLALWKLHFKSFLFFEIFGVFQKPLLKSSYSLKFSALNFLEAAVQDTCSLESVKVFDTVLLCKAFRVTRDVRECITHKAAGKISLPQSPNVSAFGLHNTTQSLSQKFARVGLSCYWKGIFVTWGC